MEDTEPGAQSPQWRWSVSMSANGFRCAECSRFRKSHSGKGVHLGKLGEGATWRRHTVIWMPAVNTGSWVLGDGTRVVRGD